MSEPTRTSVATLCSETIKPDSNGYVPPGTCGYHGKPYYPSFTLAVIFAAVAGTILMGHLIHATHYPKSYLQRFAVLISACLLLGYVARAFGTRNQQNIYLTALSDTTVLVCPILITAFDCFLLDQLIKLHRLRLQLGVYTLQGILQHITLSIAVISGLQLLTTVAIMTGNPAWLQVLGIRSYIVLIGVQGVLTLCILGGAIFLPAKTFTFGSSFTKNHANPFFMHSIWALYASLVLILLRTVYRLMELPQVFRPDSILPHKEVFFYVFEASPILASIAIWVFVPVGRLSGSGVTSHKYEYEEVQEIAYEESAAHTLNIGILREDDVH